MKAQKKPNTEFFFGKRLPKLPRSSPIPTNESGSIDNDELILLVKAPIAKKLPNHNCYLSTTASPQRESGRSALACRHRMFPVPRVSSSPSLCSIP